MTNTINVPRELLADLLGNDHDKRIMAERHLLAMLANAPSPAGVDGLEVVAWSVSFPSWQGTKVYEQRQEWAYRTYGDIAYTVEDLCRLSDAQAIIDVLRDEVEVMTQNANNYSRMFEECAEQRDQQAQRIGELEGLLWDARELITHGVFEDGVCCCGSSVEAHGFGDGHSPVDALAYYAGQVCARIDATLPAGKEGE